MCLKKIFDSIYKTNFYGVQKLNVIKHVFITCYTEIMNTFYCFILLKF